MQIRNVLVFGRLRERDLSPRPGFHHRFVLFFNLHPTAEVRLALENVLFKVHPGQLLLLFPHQHHTFVNLHDREIAVLFITFESDDQALLSHLRNRVNHVNPEMLAGLSTLAGTYLTQDLPRQKSLVILQAQLLLEQVIGADSTRAVKADTSVPPLLQEALTLVSKNPFATIRDLARRIGISEGYLRQIFRAHIGVSLGEYLVQMNLNRARGLLEYTDHSITRIAELCGYGSIYSFSRAFKKHHGDAPSGYRKRNHGPGS